MKILLINVALRPESKVKFFPIGLGYIATAIAAAGFAFDIIDIDAHRYSDEEVDRLIEADDYDVVCLGCIVTGYRFVKDLCARIRLRRPECKIVVGNSVATSIYKTLLTNTEADIAVMGEGDIAIVELLRCLELGKSLESVEGLCFRAGDKIVETPARPAIADISGLPFMNYSLFDVDIYIGSSPNQVDESVPIPRSTIRSLPVNTARGCVANCTFCYHNFRGYAYRRRSVESIAAEIGEMIGKYDLNHIAMWDELTLFSKKRAKEFADAILENKLLFYWTGDCRADCFDSDDDLDLLKRLRESGCVRMAFALESSNAEILAAMNKHITVAQFAKTTELLRKADIVPSTSLVFGYPRETPQTIRETFEVCAENGIYPSIGYLLPQPGSVMYDYARKHGFIQDEEAYLLGMGDRQDLRLNMTSMSDMEMENAVLEGARRCRDALNLDLPDDKVVKTQYYRDKPCKAP